MDIGLPVEIKKCFHADTSELFCVCGKLYIYSTNYINGFVLTNYEYRIGQPNYQFLTLFKMLVKIQYGGIGRKLIKNHRVVKMHQMVSISERSDKRFSRNTIFINFQYGGHHPI